MPGYRAVVDKDEADRLRANAREVDVDHNVTVDEAKVIVIGYRAQYDDFIAVHPNGSSDLISRRRLTFDITFDDVYPWHALVTEG